MSTALRRHCGAKRFSYHCFPAFNEGFAMTVLWPGSCPALNQKELKHLAITAPFPHPLMSSNTAQPSLRYAPRSVPSDSCPPWLALPRMQNRSYWESLSITLSVYPCVFLLLETIPQLLLKFVYLKKTSRKQRGVVRRAHLELSDLDKTPGCAPSPAVRALVHY